MFIFPKQLGPGSGKILVQGEQRLTNVCHGGNVLSPAILISFFLSLSICICVSESVWEQVKARTKRSSLVYNSLRFATRRKTWTATAKAHL